MPLVTILYANEDSKYLFNRGGEFPTEHEIPRHYTLVFQRYYKTSIKPETFFHTFNHNDRIGQDVAKKAGHTSMSVGDIVCVDNSVWFCCAYNWKDLSEIWRGNKEVNNVNN